MQSIDLKKIIISGTIAGIAWGWLAIAVNIFTIAFPFEQSLLQHLLIFAVGGAIFGIVVSGFFAILKDWLPFKNNLISCIFIATMLWIVLFIGAYILALVVTDRYHFNVPQAVQGLIMAIILGMFIGFSWKIKEKRILKKGIPR